MNCRCDKPAIVRKVLKSGDNFGKEFFTCSTGSCKLFHWVGAKIPFSVSNKWKTERRPTDSQQVGPAALKSDSENRMKAQLSIAAFDNRSSPRSIWFGVLCPNTGILNCVMRRLPQNSCRYNNGTKIWQFNMEIYEQFVSILSSSEFSNKVEVIELPRFLGAGLLRYLKRVPRDIVGSTPLNIETALLDTLLPFQVDGIQFAIQMGGRALIGDEMGCGKTIQAIGLIQHYRSLWPAVVFAPVSLLHQWQDELLRYSGDILSPSDVHIVKKSTDPVAGKICLIPYTLLDKLVERKSLLPEQFGVVIADEAHNLKSRDAKRSMVAIPFIKQVRVAICLTGTPATNRPVELFAPLSGLVPEIFNDFDAFTRRYCDARTNNFGHFDVNGCSNASELKLLLEGTVMIRRLKSDVLDSLPAKQRELRFVEPSAAKSSELKAIQKQLSKIDKSLRDASTDPALLNQLRQEQRLVMNSYYRTTGASKIEEITGIMSTLIREARKRNAENANSNNAGTIENEEQPISLELDEEFDEKTIDPAKEPTERKFVIDLEDDGILDIKCPELETAKQRTIQSDDELVDSDSDRMKASHKFRRLTKLKQASSLQPEGKSVDLEEEDDFFNCNKKKRKPKNQSDQSLPVTRVAYAASSLDDEGVVDAWKSILEYRDSVRLPKGRKNDRRSSDSEPSIGIGQKIIVFAHHQEVLDALEEFLYQEKILFVRIDGSVPAGQRDSLVKQFQEDDKTDIALLSVTACGTGINLTRANVALFAELHWSPGAVLQAEDRIHRIGQRSSSVRILYLIARGSADEIIWEQIQRKHNVLGATVGIADNRGTGMIISHRENTKDEPAQKTMDSFLRSAVIQNSLQPKDDQSNATDKAGTRNAATCSSVSSTIAKASADDIYGKMLKNESDLIPFQYHSESNSDSANTCSPVVSRESVSSNSTDQIPGFSSVDASTRRPLSPQTKARIEENRRLAAERLAQRRIGSVGSARSVGYTFTTGNGGDVVVSSEQMNRMANMFEPTRQCENKISID